MGKRPSRGMVTKTSLGSSARASAKRRSKQRGRGRILASAVGDPTVAAAWDNRLTVKANLACLGLATDPNAAVGSAAHRRLATPSSRPRAPPSAPTAAAKRRQGGSSGGGDGAVDDGGGGAGDGGGEDGAPAVMCLTLAALAARAARGEAPRPDHPAAGEVAAVRALVAAHGTDYARMARDTKRNYQQHTPAVLQRMVARVAKADAAVAAAAAAAAAAEEGAGGAAL